MDRALNPKDEKQTIYEIYRACRLCGAGAGYKMPIIQNVVDLDCDGVELRQKIRDCLQIEVTHTDRMPPLICELCVDKVNDFYEFFELCKLTNRRTRLRLGLPQKTLARDTPDSESCILGVTEPVYVEDSDGEPLTKRKSKKVKREPADTNVKVESARDSPRPESRRSRESSAEPWRPPAARRRNPSPPLPPRRATRQTVDLLQFEETDEVPTLKRPRGPELKIDTPPLPKKVKLAPEPVKTPKPGPKSSKNRESGPKSRIKEPTPDKRETTSVPKPFLSQPGPKSKTKDVPGPKSKTLDITGPKSRTHDITGPKSRTINVHPGPKSKSKVISNLKPSSLKDLSTKDMPGLRSKTHNDISAPKSRDSRSKTDINTSKTESASSKTGSASSRTESASSRTESASSRTESASSRTESASSRTSKKDAKPSPPAKTKPKMVPKVVPPEDLKAQDHICFVCNTQCKTGAGLSNHMYKHTPSFTSLKHACNPCELWFPSRDLSDTHHRTHRNNNLPYKCTRCYGYFKLLEDYDDHFNADLCLSVYEVPDVKCWECWLSFPTTKLMDEHCCAGEDGRPGGKCKKCNRNYALLKNLLKHESTCTHKKKGEIVIEPDVQARLLPMEVRMSRCDTLLPTLSTAGQVDVSTLTQKFGLDSTRVYPYLTVTVKTDPATKTTNHMVNINDDVKQEFSANTTIKHFDSDSDKSESDSDTSKPVDSLGAISLNILSKKVVGKNRKNVKTELDDISTKIDNIIDNLGEDTHNSYDSDSILDKNAAKNEVKSGSVTEGNVKEDIDKRTMKEGNDNVIDDKISEVDVKISSADAVICEIKAKTNIEVKETDTNDEDVCNNDKVGESNAEIDIDHDVTSKSFEITGDSENGVKTINDEVKDSTGMDVDDAVDDDFSNEQKTVDVNNDGETVSDNKIDVSRSLNDSPMSNEKDDSQTSCSVDSDNVLDTNKTDKADGTVDIEMKTYETNPSESDETDNSIENTNNIDHISLEETKVNDKDANEASSNENINDNVRNVENEQMNPNIQDVIVERSLAVDEIKNGEVDSKVEDTDNLETDRITDNFETISEKNNVDEQHAKTEVKSDITNFDLNIQRSPNNEDLSKIDEITNKILQENDNSLSNHSEINEHEGTTENEAKSHEISAKLDIKNHLSNETSKIVDQTSSNINHESLLTDILSNDPLKNHLTSPKIDNNHTTSPEIDKNDITSPKNITVTEKMSENSVNGVEIHDKYNDNDISEGDRKLMAELDAQIGENETRQVKSHLIDDLLRKPDDLKSLDLDSISDDEFNFDA